MLGRASNLSELYHRRRDDLIQYCNCDVTAEELTSIKRFSDHRDRLRLRDVAVEQDPC